MKAEVYPSDITGLVLAPGSKSIAQRMVACALLSKGETVLHHYPHSDDCTAALQMATSLGALITSAKDTVRIKGGFPNNFASGLRNPRAHLQCGESGLGARMFSAIAALGQQEFIMMGKGSLLQRPFGPMEIALQQLGAKCSSEEGLLPLTIQGPLKGGKAEVDGSISSQFLTGLILALPKASKVSDLMVHQAKSLPYIDMTIAVAKLFGVQIDHSEYQSFHIANKQVYQPIETIVPGDWSGAAFLMVAAAVASEKGVTIGHLDHLIPQADSAILEVLRKAGVKVSKRKDSVTIQKTVIEHFEFDAENCPDLFPPAVALAAFANGVSVIHGVQRLINKESNRAKSLQEEFGKAGVRIVIRENEMKIYPGAIRPAIINSHMDHRIAMALAILGLAGDKMFIRGAECINKSYPQFFDDLIKLGANIKWTK
jgi:3-phosphoshikimate 1-carboxyvinyltransferase